MIRSRKYLLLAPLVTMMLGALSILLVIAIVSSPELTFQASLQGLSLWWHIIFPALLPFLVLSEMLIAYGWAHGMGVLLEPLMRRVFGLPGASGWPLVMGLTTGYPGGAQATMQLVEQGELSHSEAEKSAVLSHFCNPMTVIVVIGIGLIGHPIAGYWLLGIHWLSGIIAFLTLTIFSRKERSTTHKITISQMSMNPPSRPSLIRRVITAMEQARIRDGRSFGKLLGEAVAHAVQTLMIVGGYIIIFAVIIHIVSFFILPQIPSYYVAGLFEMHLGTKALSSASSLSPIMKWSLLSALIGWSGLCALLQSISLLKKTGKGWLTYTTVKLLHGGYAFVITLLVWRPLEQLNRDIQPTFMESSYVPWHSLDTPNLWSKIPLLLEWQGLILGCLLLVSLMIALFTSALRSR
ncbi:nucleoside recognition domain-containing protein [Paenibacillus sp. IHBB 10380]|uniref:nucleoside recognition domain-containing protein n=1 Tax=Paenibacillus sp. IHBB 10380 TaxID=1566358 RepID=UPI0005CFC971|nr:nucleoside recognition domain-containing protein [Paenibacillus sp. IHBB 10380]